VPCRPQSADLDRLAARVMAQVKGGARAPLWLEVLQRAAELLDLQEEGGRHRRRLAGSAGQRRQQRRLLPS
jgi:hypothetical protein